MSITPVRPWTVSPSHVRALLIGVTGLGAAVLFRNPAMMLFSLPFAVVALWSSLTRPGHAPLVTSRVGPKTVREGQATTWTAEITDGIGVDHLIALVPERQWLEPVTRSGVDSSSVSPTSGTATLSVAFRATRWGKHEVATANIVAVSSWGAFRWHGLDVGREVTALPLPAHFDAGSASPRGNGLVGLNQSTHPGDGNEFAGIRPFQTGDRLRRINWRRSLRSNELHVTSTYADRDTHVLLAIDAIADYGVSGGIDGDPSALDTAVRAAGSLAEHFLLRGDRVSLQILEPRWRPELKVTSGSAQLRRILELLASIDTTAQRASYSRGALDGAASAPVPNGAMVIMLSPLISPVALERANTIASRGLSVAVIDTLPATVHEHDDPAAELAWRIRLLERQREIRAVGRRGVPVIHWDGPGSLDPFLREVARRAAAPRLAKR